jgi:hypothetical protein
MLNLVRLTAYATLCALAACSQDAVHLQSAAPVDLAAGPASHLDAAPSAHLDSHRIAKRKHVDRRVPLEAFGLTAQPVTDQ